MEILKAFKYRLKPSEEQLDLFLRMAGCGRLIYNHSLSDLIDIARKHLGHDGDRKGLYKLLNSLSYEQRKQLKILFPNSARMNKEITSLKKTERYSFLTEAYTDNLQQRQRDLDSAVTEWLKGKRGFPVFRSRKKAHHSTMRFVNFAKYCKLEGNRVKLPNGLGWTRFNKSQNVLGEIRSCTITKNPQGHWFIAFQCKLDIEPIRSGSGSVGIDMGVAKNMTLSNGTVFEGVNSFKTYKDKLAVEQRKLSRKVKGSANWLKQKDKVNRVHAKISNIRTDYQQKATTSISKNHAMVVVEALKITNMTKSAKGTADQHGKNVAQKSGLNRSILDQGWGEIRRQLEYKMMWQGGIYVEVDPKHTSQTCPACQHKAAENRTTQSNFACVECGYSENADFVAANNILSRGLHSLAN